MIRIKVQPLSHEAFAPFGRFYPMKKLTDKIIPSAGTCANDCTVTDLTEDLLFESEL